jgi:hypothetical protein
MAFVDGDEFLFPAQNHTITDALERYNYEKLSALGVYWVCFGSNGHISEPNGLITENFKRRSNFDFAPNKHIKSIIRGRQIIKVTNNAHYFTTMFGTFDEQLRPVTQGYMSQYNPSYDVFRINHYVCQSYEYFKSTKQISGKADVAGGAGSFRSDDWWTEHDRNDETDDSMAKYQESLKELMLILV